MITKEQRNEICDLLFELLIHLDPAERELHEKLFGPLPDEVPTKKALTERVKKLWLELES